MSEALKATGTIKIIMPTETFASGFSKRGFVVTTDDEKFPQDIKFEMFKERADALKKVLVGDKVEVTFSIRGNEYNGKYYASLNAFGVVLLEEGASDADGLWDGTESDADGLGDSSLPF